MAGAIFRHNVGRVILVNAAVRDFPSTRTCRTSVHRWLDAWGQRNMWRYARPPVESVPEDAERLLAAPAEELHPPVAPPRFTWLTKERLTFPSPVPSGDAAVDVVHCVRVRGCRSDEPRSALVMAHGAYAPGHWRTQMFLPPPERAEWDTILVELPHHMRRQRADSEYSGQFLVTADVPRLVRGIHQAEADIRAVVLGLKKEGYERVVLGGLSLGGNAVLQAVLRVHVEGAFVIVPPVDAYVSLWETVLGECLRPAGHAAGFTDDLAKRALRLITPLHMGRPATPSKRILFVHGRGDILCPPGPIEELRRAWGGCPARALDAGHVTLVFWFRTVRRIVAAWMKAAAGAVRASIL